MSARKHLGLGTWVSIGDPVVTEIVSRLGFEWLLVDMEHGSIEPAALPDNLRACAGTDIFKIVRVGEPSAHLIGHVLDYGADGIMVPHVSDAASAERVVQAMRYPPLGDRGFSTSVRAFQYGMDVPKDMSSYPTPLFMAQIENYEGVTNADSIAAVDGVDVLFVGPRDLGLDLSVRPKERTYEFDDAVGRVAAAALRHGKQAGILVRNTDDIPKFRKMGFTAMAVGSDMGMLKSGYKALLNKIASL